MLDTQLKTFLILCELKNYTKTAEHLGITQPAVSQQIKALEKRCGTQLVYFEKKKLQITEAGEQLYRSAYAVQEEMDRVMIGLQRREKEWSIRIGATPLTANGVMPLALPRLFSEGEVSRISLKEENEKEILRMLERGDVDVGIMERPFALSGYDSETVCGLSFGWICAADSALAQGCCTMEQLIGQRLLAGREGSGTRWYMNAFLQKKGISYRFRDVLEIDTTPAIVEMVKAGAGISFCCLETIEAVLEKEQVRLIEIEGAPVRGELTAVWRKDGHREEKTRRFIEGCRKALGDKEGAFPRLLQPENAP